MLKGHSALNVPEAYLQCEWFPVVATREAFAQFLRGSQKLVRGSTGDGANKSGREPMSLNFKQAESSRILDHLRIGSGGWKNVF